MSLFSNFRDGRLLQYRTSKLRKRRSSPKSKRRQRQLLRNHLIERLKSTSPLRRLSLMRTSLNRLSIVFQEENHSLPLVMMIATTTRTMMRMKTYRLISLPRLPIPQPKMMMLRKSLLEVEAEMMMIPTRMTTMKTMIYGTRHAKRPRHPRPWRRIKPNARRKSSARLSSMPKSVWLRPRSWESRQG